MDSMLKLKQLNMLWFEKIFRRIALNTSSFSEGFDMSCYNVKKGHEEGGLSIRNILLVTFLVILNFSLPIISGCSKKSPNGGSST